ncbi:MAG: hypothetical protein ABIP20_04995 [Chthoniobacteraceae bacterium]
MAVADGMEAVGGHRPSFADKLIADGEHIRIEFEAAHERAMDSEQDVVWHNSLFDQNRERLASLSDLVRRDEDAINAVGDEYRILNEVADLQQGVVFSTSSQWFPDRIPDMTETYCRNMFFDKHLSACELELSCH